MPNIVTVTVSQIVASAPSALQKTGAFVTQGGTTLSVNQTAFLTSLADLTAILNTGSAANELQAMANTFFAQGNAQGVYVLELGSGTTSAGITALAAYITNPAIRFYSYLVPSEWDADTSLVTLASNYASPTAETYFFVTTSLAGSPASYVKYEGIKSVFAGIQSPSAPSTEFSLAAMFHATLNYAPSASNLVSPLEWTYLYGVTPYVLTNTQQITLLAAGVNWVSTGAQGGISNSLIVNGVTMDNNPWNYWYSVDWLAINVAQSLAAEVINGSNNPQNPLYYNQAGINRLQTVAQSTVNNGISFGLILSPATVNATDFVTYTTENPGDYAIGKYAGLSCTFVPARGFSSITINLTASNIPV